jgi:hypothetical protein
MASTTVSSIVGRRRRGRPLRNDNHVQKCRGPLHAVGRAARGRGGARRGSGSDRCSAPRRSPRRRGRMPSWANKAVPPKALKIRRAGPLVREETLKLHERARVIDCRDRVRCRASTIPPTRSARWSEANSP